jgi:hypothetical protein
MSYRLFSSEFYSTVAVFRASNPYRGFKFEKDGFAVVCFCSKQAILVRGTIRAFYIHSKCKCGKDNYGEI